MDGKAEVKFLTKQNTTDGIHQFEVTAKSALDKDLSIKNTVTVTKTSKACETAALATTDPTAKDGTINASLLDNKAKTVAISGIGTTSTATCAYTYKISFDTDTPKKIKDLITLPKDSTNPSFNVLVNSDKTLLNRYKVYVNWLTIGGIELTKGKQTYMVGFTSTACEDTVFKTGSDCNKSKKIALGDAAGNAAYSFHEKNDGDIPTECKYYTKNSGLKENYITQKVGTPDKKISKKGTLEYVKNEKVSAAGKNNVTIT